MPEPRRVIITKDPGGQTVVVGPVGSQAAIGALRVMLARHGWTPGTEAPYKSRAEWIREQVAPAYADAARHRDEAHGGTSCNCPPAAETRTEEEATEAADGIIHVRTVTLWLCDPCLDGAGGECHTPGCSMWFNRAPDIPLRHNQGVTVHGLAPIDVPGQPATEASDEAIAAAGAVDARRDALHAWNDPDAH